MGALYAGSCYDSAASAARAYFSEVAPVVVPGSPSFVSRVYESSPDVWSFSVIREGVVVDSGPLSYPAFLSCDPFQSLLDGMQLGWLVVSCWAVAWAVVVLKRSWS